MTLSYEIGTKIAPNDCTRYYVTVRRNPDGSLQVGPRVLRKLVQMQAWRCRMGTNGDYVHFDENGFLFPAE